MKDGKTLWRFIMEHSPKILSAHPTSWMPNSKKDKSSWVQKNLGLNSSDVHLVKRAMKREYATTNGQPNVLIDDHSKNIKEWQAAGGIGILHRNATSTIQKLKKMGFWLEIREIEGKIPLWTANNEKKWNVSLQGGPNTTSSVRREIVQERGIPIWELKKVNEDAGSHKGLNSDGIIFTRRNDRETSTRKVWSVF